MYVDAQNLFSSAQAITVTAASDNLIDLGSAVNLGTGQDVYVVVVVTTAFTDAGSDATVAVTVQTDTASTFGSATTAQTIGTLGAVSAAGARLIAKLQKFTTAERYVRLYYTVANGPLTAGAVTAFLTVDVHDYTVYPDNITIS